MSRLRTLKPGFFQNDLLAECDPLTRLLFAGLWTEADRDGRLKDRPKRIKAAILPYDNCDADVLLNELASRGFIVRYVVDGERYIAIPQWYAHQKPHPKERSNGYPAPPKRRVLQESREKVGIEQDLGEYEPGGLLSLGSCLLSLGEEHCPPDGEPLVGEVVEEYPFDDFWACYPKRVAKKKAAESWRRLPADDRRKASAIAAIMGDLWERGLGPEELRLVPNATTFLNGERWDDWECGPPPGWGGGNGSGRPRDDGIDAAVAAVMGGQCDQ